MTTFLLILLVLIVLIPPLRALAGAVVIGALGLVAITVGLPFVKLRSLVRNNTGEGKFMQPGQGPILVLLILLVPCILMAVALGLSRM